MPDGALSLLSNAAWVREWADRADPVGFDGVPGLPTLSLALDQGLPIVPSTRGLRKNLAGPVPVYHPQRSPGHASNGDVARLTSLVLGRSKSESAGLVFPKES